MKFYLFAKEGSLFLSDKQSNQCCQKFRTLTVISSFLTSRALLEIQNKYIFNLLIKNVKYLPNFGDFMYTPVLLYYSIQSGQQYFKLKI